MLGALVLVRFRIAGPTGPPGPNGRPVSKVGAGPFVGSPGRNISARVASACGAAAGMLIGEDDVVTVCTCTGTGGLTGNGIVNCGAILIGCRRSGRTKGIASKIPTSAHCIVSEPSVVHRRVPETTRPLDSTRLPSNIRHLRTSDRCASARNASTSIDTAAAQLFPPRTSNLEPSTMNHP